jgi:NAD(P)-dependent dehydrogenase (short-subunit alcohol dehydrogenase family)
MLSKVMAVEWAEHNVRVNTIHPGTIETELTQYSYPTEELRARREKTIPLNRFGTPEEVAKAAIFLVSEDASCITGHSLVIDGGFQNSLFQLTERLLH